MNDADQQAQANWRAGKKLENLGQIILARRYYKRAREIKRGESKKWQGQSMTFNLKAAGIYGSLACCVSAFLFAAIFFPFASLLGNDEAGILTMVHAAGVGIGAGLGVAIIAGIEIKK